MKKYKYIAVCLMASVLLTTGCADSFLEVLSYGRNNRHLLHH